MGQVVNAPAVHTTDWNQSAKRASVAEAPGKPTGLSRGGWLSDMTALRKMVTICHKCVARWNPKLHGYVRARIVPDWPDCFAECDGCATEGTCQSFKPQEGF